MTISRIAGEWLGTPFVHGATMKGVGADCLGLVVGVLRETGKTFNVPGYPPEPLEGHEEQLLRVLETDFKRATEPRPGHILLFRWRRLATHLGICTDAGVIHASSIAGCVVEVPLFPVLARKLHSCWEPN